MLAPYLIPSSNSIIFSSSLAPFEGHLYLRFFFLRGYLGSMDLPSDDTPLNVSKEFIDSTLKYISSLSQSQLDGYLAFINSKLFKLPNDLALMLEESSRRRFKIEAARTRELAKVRAKFSQELKDLFPGDNVVDSKAKDSSPWALTSWWIVFL